MFLGHGILDIELGLTHIWLENKLRGAVSGITSTTYKLKTAKPAMIKKKREPRASKFQRALDGMHAQILLPVLALPIMENLAEG